MKVKTLIMELLNNTSPEAEIEIEFNKTLLPNDKYVYCQLSPVNVTGNQFSCTIHAEVVE
jgi:hypothetical protein